MTIDKICWALVRWVVDEYHNTPHRGLDGETPGNAWISRTETYGIRPPPGRDELRNVFGIELTRLSGPLGVTVMGLSYQGTALQEHRRIYGDREILLRYDPADIGAISVRLGDAWYPVSCLTPGFDGVSMDDWRLAANALRKRFGHEAKLAAPIVNAAVRDIQALAQRTLATIGLGSEMLSPETIAKAERDLMISFRMPGSDDETGPMLDPVGDGPRNPDAPASDAAAPTPADPRPSPSRRPQKRRLRIKD